MRDEVMPGWVARCAAVGVFVWLGAGVLLGLWTGGSPSWDRLGRALGQSLLANPVTFTLVALLARRLTAAQPWWRRGLNRWEFGGFAIVVGAVSLLVNVTLVALYELIAGGFADPVRALVGAVLATLFLMFFGLYPLWCLLGALIVGPGPASSRPVSAQEAAGGV